MKNVKKNKHKECPTYLRKVKESWLTEQDVSQEHGPAGQHFDLIFTEMMAPQESTKVPGVKEDQVMIHGVTMENNNELSGQTETYCCSSTERTTDWAMTKQFGSTMPSSPHIFAAQGKRKHFSTVRTLCKGCAAAGFNSLADQCHSTSAPHQQCRFWSALWWGWASQHLERCTLWKWWPHLFLYLQHRKRNSSYLWAL